MAPVKVNSDQPPELFEFLQQKYLETLPASKGKVLAPKLTLFVEFCRELLAKDPPVGRTYSNWGFGILLQSGIALEFAKPPQLSGTSASVQITTPRSQPNQEGIVDAGSVPITSPPKK